MSGLEVGFGGVWVGAAPYLLFIPDRNADDRPDGKPEVLLDGWGYQDTHETLNSFTWGPDGWLYGCHGVFTHSKVGVPGAADDERTPLNAGVWRLHPVRKDFEVFAWGTSNPWGVDFNDHGQCFIEACVIPHFWHMIQGGRYQRQGRAALQSVCLHRDRDHCGSRPLRGGHPGPRPLGAREHDPEGCLRRGRRACPLRVVDLPRDQLSKEYRNQPLFFNVHGHRINRETLTRSGSGWKASHAPDFLETFDKWFMGVALDYGPDGALYFIDWYDKTNCHRRQPERWDRSNGRMYRVRYKGWEAAQVDLTNRSELDLAGCSSTRTSGWCARRASSCRNVSRTVGAGSRGGRAAQGGPGLE